MFAIKKFASSILLLIIHATTVFAQSPDQPDGYWKFVRMETEHRDPYKDATWSWKEEEGRLVISDSRTIDPGKKFVQSISAEYKWQRPPEILYSKTKLTFPIAVNLLINSHPSSGIGLGGGSTSFFGWVQGGAGSNCFKDAEGNYMAGFDNSQKSGLNVVWAGPQQPSVVLRGSYEIPSGSHLDAPVEDNLKIMPLVFAATYSNDYRKYKYIYAWHPGKLPVTSNAGLDVSGVWKHGSNGESWTFTRKPDGSYTAVEKGFGNAKGTATVKDNTILIDYTTDNGIHGKYTITVDSSGKTGTGKWTSDQPDSGTRDFVRVSTGPSSGATGTDPTSTGSDAIKGFTVRAGLKLMKAGETAPIAIDLLQPSNLGNLNVNIEYDPTVVQVNSIPAAGSAKGNRLFEANHRQPGIVRLGLAGNEGLTADGQLASIPFTAIGPPGSSTVLKVSVTMANDSDGKALSAATLDGAIEIAAAEPPPPPPPPTYSGKDALDALKMSVQLLAEDLRADLDKDGKVTSNDARLILRAIVNQK